ncbi:hypothetical protein MalM25_26650 [Planctomycetes bacterium MalM25]|nr:hypothetical protein MalM25_26650 [Planctomycetes bacterium MalM25]
MTDWLTKSLRAFGALAMVAACCAAAAQVPLDGFFPLVGIGLTDEFIFDDLLGQNPVPATGVSGNLLGAGGTPFYDLALLDTGAGLSLVTDAAFDRFGLGEPGQGGGSDGYRGTETVPIGGATGTLTADINDPLGLYASGLQDRTGAGAALAMNNAALQGQTNTSTLTFPPDSELPNVVGLPFASQYATRIRNDQPQVFQLEGKTIRTPAIDFLPLGSGGGDIIRKAPLSLNPGAAFTTPPGYFQNILNIVDGIPVHENPQLPTGMAGGIASGGLFLDMFASNDGLTLGSQSDPIGFFFDTGASVTVLSEASAAAIGFDVVTDTPEFTISIIGSGGEIGDVPGFYLDQITLPALGGAIVANNVPVVVLDVTDVSDPGNIVPGILGTNLLAGRNVVIDPNPSIGAGGESAGVYISDPVTTLYEWSTASASAPWSDGSSWAKPSTPTYLSKTMLEPTGAGSQVAVVAGDQQAWETFIEGGNAGQTMTVHLTSGSKLTTFSGLTVNEGGVLQLDNGVVDAQYVDVRGGRLTGEGAIKTGSGPIGGQVETLAGTIAPGLGVGTLSIEGRLSLGEEAIVEIELAGTQAGSEHDQIVVMGPTALSGEIEVSLVGVYEPTVGDTFELITHENRGGEFTTINLPTGYVWDLDYNSEAVVLEVMGLGLTGDFNNDGAVDAADYTVWRDGLGVTFDDTDYVLWKSNYGATLTSPAVSVPEPSTLLLMAFLGLSVSRVRG